MLARWLPWKFLVRRAARAYGIIDPLNFLARFRQFAQPSEVQEPIELLRAGIIFHARGLINKAIQNNLDWVWPYWVERQYDPKDMSFIPRAFSFSHINLTHRNWTAVGHPDLPLYPLVDPRGLITPLYDGWSIDLWLVSSNEHTVFPSRVSHVDQNWILSPNLGVETTARRGQAELQSLVQLEIMDNSPFLRIQAKAGCPEPASLAVVLRPCNPEGIQFIDEIAELEDGPGWLVNQRTPVGFDRSPDQVFFSDYDQGDVLHQLNSPRSSRRISCRVGMATAAALFPVSTGETTCVSVHIPLSTDLPHEKGFSSLPEIQTPVSAWEKALSGLSELQIPDRHIKFLFQAALRSLVLLSADYLVPGPYTYRRFWFRDACLMLNSLMCVNMLERSGRILDTFPSLQKISGYFQSQKGEWDSNGQVLWILDRFQRLTQKPLNPGWKKSVSRAAAWISRKRMKQHPESPHAGLLPAGFSAEHLGPNDYYYWDDFWGLAGLQAASRLSGLMSDAADADKFASQARDFEQCIFRSIKGIPDRRSRQGMPASPYRRMDAGAVGSLVADYPLQLTLPGDQRIMNTISFLMENCFYKGAFFQDMIHSGLNAYLTLDIAQALLRAGDKRFRDMVRAVADMASPTGQWPEAVHPLTGGGCMGDGQHGWAAAEWVMIIRNIFVREEGNSLILGSGIFPRWITSGEDISFGPTRTPFGPVQVSITHEHGQAFFGIKADFSSSEHQPENIVIAVPGYEKINISPRDKQKLPLTKS